MDTPQQNETPEGCITINNPIQFEDFTKVSLQVGTIKEAHPIPKATKLLRLLVDIGEETPRQILAGIAEYYAPETLIDTQAIVVTNLAPRTMRGFTSYGMLLAIRYGESLCLVRPENRVPAGSTVS